MTNCGVFQWYSRVVDGSTKDARPVTPDSRRDLLIRGDVGLRDNRTASGGRYLSSIQQTFAELLIGIDSAVTQKRPDSAHLFSAAGIDVD